MIALVESATEGRHTGDLGNIEADDDGVATVDIKDARIQLCGAQSIVGRALVVHADEDDLGTVNSAASRKTGNAGDRLGCCVIGITQ
ncbi:PREDICTED: superoxide dismutase [Cu-Zn] 2-like [Priapulus caudatus]|uniref:Superoxide dismutase [Cu-Zn] n=1 Tax=Priapulus caudatus TaxID=37621 RepID=A0ABM1F2N2_PRICU|nr:PREDICTED: superoxide dismutase [Cu-Zn] 2-like [Priapulus caudatus]